MGKKRTPEDVHADALIARIKAAPNVGAALAVVAQLSPVINERNALSDETLNPSTTTLITTLVKAIVGNRK